MKSSIALAIMIALAPTDGMAMVDLESATSITAPTEKVPAELQRLRELYFAAVQSPHSLALAEREVQTMRAADLAAPNMDVLLTAYSGALRTLRAKHGSWPPARLRDLQEGLRTLDGLVDRHPDVAEVRYLRLMSCYYLPALLGRTGSVREDFQALGRLLPAARHSFSRELYSAAAEFVLENGELQPNDRARLERSLAR